MTDSTVAVISSTINLLVTTGLGITAYQLGKQVGRRETLKWVKAHFPSFSEADFLIFLDAAKREEIAFKAVATEDFKNQVEH